MNALEFRALLERTADAVASELGSADLSHAERVTALRLVGLGLVECAERIALDLRVPGRDLEPEQATDTDTGEDLA